jgi:hypothetical protein
MLIPVPPGQTRGQDRAWCPCGCTLPISTNDPQMSYSNATTGKSVARMSIFEGFLFHLAPQAFPESSCRADMAVPRQIVGCVTPVR